MIDRNDPWAGLKPTRPKAELRAHVLAAARHAATQPAHRLLEALYRDRLLRVCAAGLAALALANAIVTGDGGARVPAPAISTVMDDGASIPGDAGLTVAEQADELAPVIGDTFARRRG